MYALRSFLGLGLLAAIGMAWINESHLAGTGLATKAHLGESIFYAVVGVQLTLVLLAAPAATAGAICLDKARGVLVHLLVTDLSAAEIVLGKLAARLLPVIGLVACAAPVLFICMLFGGIDPEALVGAEIVVLGVACAGCALALALSVWCKKTYEVVLVVYAFWLVVLLSEPIYSLVTRPIGPLGVPFWLENVNPYWVAFAPYWRPGTTTWLEPVAFLAGCLVFALAGVVIAMARARVVTVRQAGQSALATKWWSRLRWQGLPVFRPGLDGNPVLWRDWHYRRPGGWVRAVWFCYGLLALAFTATAHYQASTIAGLGGIILPAFVNGLQVAVGLLLLSVLSVTSLAEERVRNSFDVLLTTPLPTRAIVWGKWLGVYRKVFWLLLLPVLLTSSIAYFDISAPVPEDRWRFPLVLGALILTWGAAITSLGLALATAMASLPRAVASSVSAYVALSVGLLFVMVVWSPPHPNEFAMASPFFGATVLTAYLREVRGDEDICLAGAFWAVGFLASAVVLYVGVLLSFNYFMGRMSGRRWRVANRALQRS